MGSTPISPTTSDLKFMIMLQTSDLELGWAQVWAQVSNQVEDRIS